MDAANDAGLERHVGRDAPTAGSSKTDLLEGILLLARFHGISVSRQQLKHDFALGESGHLDDSTILLIARSIGLKANIAELPFDRLRFLSLPAMVLGGEETNPFIVAKVSDEKMLVHDIVSGRPLLWNIEEAKAHYTGRALLVSTRAPKPSELGNFDLTWFIPAVIKYRKLFIEVLTASLFIQLLALVTPLFFQVVMDKVLVHNAMTTLTVISVALLGVTLFNAALSGLRTFVFSHTTSRIDVELGARLFRHILALPLSYFGARRVGDTIARVRELENIRSFLTGQALTSLLDMLFTVVFLAVMFSYSLTLTVLVIISLPLYAIWSASITPTLRRRLNEKFSRGADNQAFLVETISGIATIKSSAVEPVFIKRWNEQLAEYVRAGWRASNSSNLGQQGVQLIQKLVSIGLLYWGAKLVVSGSLSIGQLIAFNMLAGQVAAPIVRLAQLWQDFQQVGISVRRLADILDSRTESSPSRTALPKIAGQISIQNVTFRYRPDAPPVLLDVSLNMAAGEVVGIVGPSGSGKSTLTQLLQRLHTPEQGRILIDGHDLALVDPAWLRRQLGVVLQESFLFNRSVRENIALGDPGMPMERIIRAARLAGAHKFILEMTHGYDTIVGEHGATLSGGQRQRIAIARSLVFDPRILILDEATSALDYESEQAIMANMRDICRGRTVIIIAHRLSTVQQANRIFVVERGKVVETGAPHELLAKAGGYFERLSKLQQGAGGHAT